MSFYIQKTKSPAFTLVPKQVNNTVKVNSNDKEITIVNNTDKIDSKDKEIIIDKQEIPVCDVYNNLTQNTNLKKLSSKSVLTFNQETNSWGYNDNNDDDQ
jgi:hypothetical protein